MTTPVPVTMLRHQGPMLKALGKVALSAIKGPSATGLPPTPGPDYRDVVEPRPGTLIDTYAAWCGAATGRYAGTLPPHLFPQWGFPLLSKTLGDLPFKLTGVLNQGCRMTIHGPIPRGADLHLRARLEAVTEDDRKTRIHQRLWTGTSETETLMVSDVFAVVLKPGKRGGGKKSSSKSSDELNAFSEVGRWQADRQDGRRFGILTGDLNPIHWLGPYAKAAGFPRQILHGFGSLARSYEALQNAWPEQTIAEFDVRFTRPLVLPAATRVLATTTGIDREIRLLDAKDKVCMAGSVALNDE